MKHHVNEDHTYFSVYTELYLAREYVNHALDQLQSTEDFESDEIDEIYSLLMDVQSNLSRMLQKEEEEEKSE